MRFARFSLYYLPTPSEDCRSSARRQFHSSWYRIGESPLSPHSRWGSREGVDVCFFSVYSIYLHTCCWRPSLHSGWLLKCQQRRRDSKWKPREQFNTLRLHLFTGKYARRRASVKQSVRQGYPSRHFDPSNTRVVPYLC